MKKILFLTLALSLSQHSYCYENEDYEEPTQDYSESGPIPSQLPIAPTDDQKYDEVVAPEFVPTPAPMEDSSNYEQNENYDEY